MMYQDTDQRDIAILLARGESTSFTARKVPTWSINTNNLKLHPTAIVAYVPLSEM